MARVTVEDCIVNIPNRFDLVVTAAQRAKQIASGSPLTQDRDNDKDAVVSLREIADETIDITLVQEELIQNYQKQYSFDRVEHAPEDELAALGDNSSDELAGDMEGFMNESSGQSYGGLSFIEENVEVDD